MLYTDSATINVSTRDNGGVLEYIYMIIKPDKIIKVYTRIKQQITQLTHLSFHLLPTRLNLFIQVSVTHLLCFNTAYTFKQAMRLWITIDPNKFLGEHCLHKYKC